PFEGGPYTMQAAAGKTVQAQWNILSRVHFHPSERVSEHTMTLSWVGQEIPEVSADEGCESREKSGEAGTFSEKVFPDSEPAEALGSSTAGAEVVVATEEKTETKPVENSGPRSDSGQLVVTSEGLAKRESDFELNKADTIAKIAKGVVHDFNNSLAAIRGHLQIIQPDVEVGSLSYQAIQKVIITIADTSTELCRKLLNYTKGRREDKRACPVEELVNEAIAITGFGSNVTCQKILPEDLWMVMAERIEMVQVINNLLINAQQAMPDGGSVLITAENLPVEPGFSLELEPNDYVAITIRDRGTGISEEEMPKIFDALYTTKKEGSGLGLYTCAGIVQSHGGHIEVRSKKSVGTEVLIYIPAATEKEAARSRAKKKEDADAEGLVDLPLPIQRKARVLMVEDQEEIYNVGRTFLEQSGHTVAWASSGQEAVEIYRKQFCEGRGFDVVIMDLTLPGGMSGEDTLKELRRVDPEVRCVASSGSFDRNAGEEFRRKGFTAILPKPYPLENLESSVRRALLMQTA
ncbi:MAG: ATP-binding protein, partial [Verrucomicrobiota bacterium]